MMRIACVIALLAAVSPALAAEPADTVRQFIGAFDKGDTAAAATTYAPAAVSIIDELPPYSWQGPNAFQNWMASAALFDKLQGISSESVAAGAVLRQEVSGGRAYVILPATYTFTQKGVKMQENAQWTFALSRNGPDWKIAGWTWTAPRATPAGQ